ncbi:unnamed protein product [Dracunculus medinensis]|uniref:rRNA biogenesis protein RRP36 n=1 Tax=Dracunculus medinensis TaxID=318479 RepID=A0A0N4U134_DRAME|nr:unnamed protein product [Dracunculus medinensis]
MVLTNVLMLAAAVGSDCSKCSGTVISIYFATKVMEKDDSKGTLRTFPKKRSHENRERRSKFNQSSRSISDTYFEEFSRKSCVDGSEENDDQSLYTSDNSEENFSGDEEIAVDSSGEIRKEIANMPLFQVKSMKEKLGVKLFNQTFFESDHSKSIKSTKKPEIIKPRDHPRRPREVSSKIPVPKFRTVYPNERINKQKFDPRFEDSCGLFNEYIYKTNYSFLDELQQNEKKILSDELKNAKLLDKKKADRLRAALRRLTDKEKSKIEAERRKDVVREVRKENEERMRQGLKPIYYTRGQLKRRYMEKKFEELKKTKKLDKYLERKAKKRNRIR